MPSRPDMAVDWENHHEGTYSSQVLSSHTDTPYRAPTASMSRHSLHRRGSSAAPSRSSSPTSPPDRPNVENRGNMLDISEQGDDSISPLDPRRFTPTLHASLVSEILSVRRDLENKVKEMDSLEVNLDHTKSEAEKLQETLAKTAKENRSLKRQLQLLEGGSLSAITELAKERDEAQDSISDVRKRLEQTQKKLRNQEEQTDKSQAQWDNDRQKWDEERRNLERKVHVVEGRLKIVLNEVAAAQAANSPSHQSQEADVDEATRDANNVNDTPNRTSSVMGRRRTSTASSTYEVMDLHNNSNRFSVMSMQNGNAQKPEGLSLADELAFDEEEEYDDEYYLDERSDSRATFSRDRPSSMQSHGVGIKARKTLGMPLDGFELAEPSQLPRTPRQTDDLDDDDAKTISQTVPSRFEYRDTGIQYTPPPSPPLVALENGASTNTADDNAREKVFPANYQTADTGINTDPIGMISSSCQTIREEPSPPITPDREEAPPESKEVQTTTSSTQTTDQEAQDETPPPPESPIEIPMIAIHPPESSPPSPRSSVVLPPRTKSVSCQTDKEPAPTVQSSSVQTEEIRLDRRPIKVASSLLPSAIQDQPPSADSADIKFDTPIPPYCPPPPRSAKRRAPPPPPEPAPVEEKVEEQEEEEEPETVQAYPGNNDNGPLAEDKQMAIRRPPRTSSLFAGFEQSSDEENAPAKESGDIFSDEELIHRPMASYTLRYGKVVSKGSAPPTILDEPEEEEEEEGEQSPKSGVPAQPKGKLQRSTARAKSTAKRPPRLKQPDIRRAAMISSSSAAHQSSSRPRSPSAPSFGSSSTHQAPPFPVPIRLSSRKVPISSSEGATSPTPYGHGQFPDDLSELPPRRDPLRKVRSDAAVARMSRSERQQSNSPTTLSTSSAAPDSPQPPMPFDDITAPEKKRAGRQQRPNRPEAAAGREDPHARGDSSAATVQQQTSVVDAIAQTMVGEWMWKYVRRRRSFGMPDSSRDQWDAGKNTEEVSANISGSGVRHQRWVWLAPYERAVMWSNKQPISGSALLGKTGRKLVIQSVLDVKDDNPLPKGTAPQNQFNRSILILTPQRALKFTALTLDRHFVWLTALSFLSHSSMDINDLASLPPVPKEEEDKQHAPAPALRRNPIRDSIRVAKGKRSWNNKQSAAGQTPAVPEVPGDAAYANEPVPDAADPPNIPRFSAHTRKRSNTAPRPLPPAIRSFSNNNAPPAPSTYSTTTAGSSDLYSPTSIGPPGVQSGQSSISHRTSEASGPFRGGQTSNFFDAVGTVRMEAFVDRAEQPRPRGTYRTRHGGRRRKEPNYWPQSPETDFPRSEDGSDVFSRHDDPFRGF